jgi:hypothetical protein
MAGFVEALAGVIADRFRFSVARLHADLPLRAGVHVFAEDMPEVEQIARTAGAAYDEHHPTLALYDQGGVGNAVSSSHGGRLEWTIRVVLRHGTNTARVDALAAEFYAWAQNHLPGARAGAHMIKAVIPSSRPVGVYYEGDRHAFASMTLRFLGVALPVGA